MLDRSIDLLDSFLALLSRHFETLYWRPWVPTWLGILEHFGRACVTRSPVLCEYLQLLLWFYFCSCIPHRPDPERLQEQDSSFRSSSAAPLVEVCDSNLYELSRRLQPTSTLTHLCIAFFENEALQYGIIEALDTAKSVERSWNRCLGHWQKRRKILQTVEKIRNTKCLDRFETWRYSLQSDEQQPGTSDVRGSFLKSQLAHTTCCFLFPLLLLSRLGLWSPIEFETATEKGHWLHIATRISMWLMQKRRNSKGGTWCLASLILQTAFGLCKNQLHCLLEHQTRASNQTALQLCENQLHCLLEHQTRASNQTVLQLCENQLHCLLEHQTKVQTAVECVKISFILYWSIDQAALWLRC